MTVDEKDAKRIKREFKQSMIYFVLARDEDDMVDEVIASVSDHDMNRDDHTLSDLDTIARLTSMVLRHYDLDEVVVNLLQTSRGPHTKAGIVADVLLEYGQG